MIRRKIMLTVDEIDAAFGVSWKIYMECLKYAVDNLDEKRVRSYCDMIRRLSAWRAREVARVAHSPHQEARNEHNTHC